MDREEFLRKAEQALNQAFETAKKSAKGVAKRAGEAAQVTKLLVEKVTLEHRVTKQFTRLGGCVYEKAAHQGRESLSQDPDIRSLIDETKRLEDELTQVDSALQTARRQKKTGKPRSRS